jgi:hypothetical protein
MYNHWEGVQVRTHAVALACQCHKFSPGVRFLLPLASCFSWPVASFDVKLAFLHSNIDHKIYIQPPRCLSSCRINPQALKGLVRYLAGQPLLVATPEI